MDKNIEKWSSLLKKLPIILAQVASLYLSGLKARICPLTSSENYGNLRFQKWMSGLGLDEPESGTVRTIGRT